MGLTDKNLFAYCDNNPIMRIDKDGEFWHIVAGAVVGAIVGATVSTLSQLFTEGSVDLKQVGISAAAGMLSGALTSTGLGAAVQIAGGALISGAENFVSQGVDKGFENVDYKDVAVSAVMGGISSRKSGLSKGDAKHLMNQGKNTIKNFRGFKKTAKYYFSQTYKKFYKKEITDAFINTFNGIAKNTANHYLSPVIKPVLERYLYG